jgi:enoyl-CoA hydratase
VTAGFTSSIIGEDGHRKAPSTPPDYPEFRAVSVDFEDRLAVVTLGSDPARANPSDKMTPELAQFFRLVRYDPRVRAILIQGRGHRFSSGGNVKGMRDQATRMGNLAENPDWVARLPVDRSDELPTAILGVDVPIVAAITGHAVGAGLALAMWADYSVIDEAAKIGDPHVRRGLVSPSAYVFPSLIGMQRARALLLTGKLIDGRRAEQIGLVNEAVPFDDVIATARAVAEDLAALPPLAVRWTKRILTNMTREQFARYSLEGASLEALTMLSADHADAVGAWLDKSSMPTFRGR